MRYLIRIEQTVVGTVTVEAGSELDALDDAEFRRGIHGNWGPVVDQAFEVVDEVLTAELVVEEKALDC